MIELSTLRHRSAAYAFLGEDYKLSDANVLQQDKTPPSVVADQLLYHLSIKPLLLNWLSPPNTASM